MADGLEEEEHVVTMSEYFEGIEAQELEADLVLGGDEGKECTYSKGYMARQAVFSCLTCTPEGNAGVCTACSMNCHDGHEVVELWTRRHFRCDCGNSKFGVGVCRLYSSKDVENGENTYNHNYKGVYCTCKRPYPDPDGEDQGEMLQCCICEDWFHENHLGLESTELVPRDDEGEPVFDELVCQACAGRLQFLSFYKELLLPLQATAGSVTKPDEEHSSIGNKHVNVQEAGFVISEESATETSGSVPSEVVDVEAEHNISLQVSSNVSCNATELQKSKLEHKPVGSSHHVRTEITHCKLKQVKSGIAGLPCEHNNGLGDVVIELSEIQVKSTKALFLSKNWRTQLCHCNECLHMYSVKGVGFLLDSEDTLHKYEEIAQQKRKEKMEAAEGDGLAMLKGLGHVEQIEFLHKLNDMTSELSSFFASFKESGKTVTRTDVQDFFENLNRKRKRLE